MASVDTIFAAAAAERTAEITVGNMWCPSCPYIVQQAIDGIDGARVTGGELDRRTQTVSLVVVYDDEKTDIEAILAEPTSYGYPASLVEPGG